MLRIKGIVLATSDLTYSKEGPVKVDHDARAVIPAWVLKGAIKKSATQFSTGTQELLTRVVYLTDALTQEPVTLKRVSRRSLEGSTLSYVVIPQGTGFYFEMGIEATHEQEIQPLMGVLAKIGIRIGSGTTRGLGNLKLTQVWAASGLLGSFEELKDPTQWWDPTLMVEGNYLIEVSMSPLQGLLIPQDFRGFLGGGLLAGVLRARARKILEVLKAPHLEEIEKGIFGGDGKRSKVITAPIYVEGGKEAEIPRVMIDEFSGGLVSTRPDRMRVLIGATLKSQLILEGVKGYEAALVLLALRDICTGMVPVGGGGAIGLGFVEGIAKVFTREWSTTIGREVQEVDPRAEELLKEFKEVLRSKE